MAGFSSSHFSARFRAATGYTVLEYVKRLRMAKARQLLISGETSISEVAAAVGYADALYFSRQFSAVNQLSPNQFRARSHASGRPATGSASATVNTSTFHGLSRGPRACPGRIDHSRGT